MKLSVQAPERGEELTLAVGADGVLLAGEQRVCKVVALTLVRPPGRVAPGKRLVLNGPILMRSEQEAAYKLTSIEVKLDGTPDENNKVTLTIPVPRA